MKQTHINLEAAWEDVWEKFNRLQEVDMKTTTNFVTAREMREALIEHRMRSINSPKRRRSDKPKNRRQNDLQPK